MFGGAWERWDFLIPEAPGVRSLVFLRVTRISSEVTGAVKMHPSASGSAFVRGLMRVSCASRNSDTFLSFVRFCRLGEYKSS